ncbi:MAG: DUF6516 family protein [Euryarchaeota archaeon]|nr:DUF6516 family protein [Euryarchaeota archaeon]
MIRSIYLRIEDEDDTIKIFGCLLFVDGSLLYFFEYNALGELRGCRFRWQTREGNMIAQYDNAPHFTNITTFPDHKHIPVGVIPSKQRKLRDVIKEIEQEML